MFDITQRGATTTVATNNKAYKITWSERYHRFQVKLDGKLISEGSFQGCLDKIDRLES